jgi:hypothetical protein
MVAVSAAQSQPGHADPAQNPSDASVVDRLAATVA